MITIKLEGEEFTLEIQAEKHLPPPMEEDTSESVGRNSGRWFGQARITHSTGGDRQTMFLLMIEDEDNFHLRKYQYRSPYKDGVFTNEEDRTRQELLQSLFRIKGWTDKHQIRRDGKLNDAFISEIFHQLDLEMSSKPIVFPLKRLRRPILLDEWNLHHHDIVRIPIEPTDPYHSH